MLHVPSVSSYKNIILTGCSIVLNYFRNFELTNHIKNKNHGTMKNYRTKYYVIAVQLWRRLILSSLVTSHCMPHGFRHRGDSLSLFLFSGIDVFFVMFAVWGTYSS